MYAVPLHLPDAFLICFWQRIWLWKDQLMNQHTGSFIHGRDEATQNSKAVFVRPIMQNGSHVIDIPRYRLIGEEIAVTTSVFHCTLHRLLTAPLDQHALRHQVVALTFLPVSRPEDLARCT